MTGPLMKFCERVVAGDTGEAAWRASHPKAKASTCRVEASKSLTKPNIRAEIQRLRDKADELAGSAVMTLAEKRKFLAEVVRTPIGDVDSSHQLAQEYQQDEKSIKIKMPCKLKALELDSKLAGEFAEDKNKAAEVDALASLMQSIATGK